MHCEVFIWWKKRKKNLTGSQYRGHLAKDVTEATVWICRDAECSSRCPSFHCNCWGCAGSFRELSHCIVNCLDWARKKKISKTGLLLTGLATTRICLIWIISLDACIKVFFPSMYRSYSLIESIAYMWLTVNYLSVWFAASLSIFYFLKIANFSNYVFLWMKRKTVKVFYFLVGCLLILWLISFSLIVENMEGHKMKQRNRTWEIHQEGKKAIINYVSMSESCLSLWLPYLHVSC